MTNPRSDHPLPPAKVRLSRLRDIGWTKWDPIGLLKDDQTWQDKDCQGFANEYDKYLLQAAAQLRRGVSEKTVVDYLVDIEVEHMGLPSTPGAFVRAKDVVAAILEDEELWVYPD